MEASSLQNCLLVSSTLSKPCSMLVPSTYKFRGPIKSSPASKLVISRSAKKSNDDCLVKKTVAAKEDEEEVEEELEEEAILQGEDEGREPDDYNRRAQIFDTCSKMFLDLHQKEDGEELDTNIHSIPFDY